MTGPRAYLPLTESALRWLGIEAAAADWTPRVERSGHLADVRGFVRELPDCLAPPSRREPAIA